MKTRNLFSPLILLLFLNTMFCQTVPIEKGSWNAYNNDNNESIEVRIEEFKGKNALLLERHEIAVPNIDFSKYKNFTIELDMAGNAMPGIGFRANDLWSYGFLFLRLFNSGKQNAIQYVPVYNGASSWQLYNYPVYEGFAEFERMEWIHLKLQVYDDRMRVFINDSSIPNLETELPRENPEGKAIFLKTNFDNAYFANISITQLKEPFKVIERKNKYTYLTNWNISEQFESEMKTQFEVYRIIDGKRNLRPIKADRHGLVNLSRYYDHPKNWALAKTTFVSTKKQTKELLFDYSSIAALVLNGQIIFSGRELDTHNYGLVEDGEQKQQLHLKEGKNTLVFLVKADDLWQEGMDNPTYLGRKQGMNWGFISRLSDYKGIELN